MVELKKILLLELKHSTSGRLEIFGKSWTKNEILAIFETDFQQDTFDVDAFELKYPFLKLLANPAKIQYELDEKEKNIFYDPGLKDYQIHSSNLYLQSFSLELKKVLRNEKLKQSEAIISYTDFFLEEELYDLKHQCQSIILQLLTEDLQSKNSRLLFIWDGYRNIVNFAANDDHDFLFKQLQLIEKFYSKLTLDEAIKALRIQLQLEHPIEIKLQLQEFIKNFQNKKSSSLGEDKKSSPWTTYIIIAVVIFIIRIVFLVGKHNSTPSYYIPPNNELLEQYKRSQEAGQEIEEMNVEYVKEKNYDQQQLDSIVANIERSYDSINKGINYIPDDSEVESD